MARIRILLTGGGTAGHIWPIIAISESLLTNKRAQVLYVGSHSGPEGEIANRFGVPYRNIYVGKWRSYLSISNIWDLFKTSVGLIQSYFILVFFKPDVVFAKGGYVTFPIIYWTKFFKIPLIIHESDLVMGKANRWIANYAKKVCLGFPVQYYKDIKGIDLNKLVYTGTPVRSEFFDKIAISKDKPTILITGGSQGSQKINEVVSEILPELIKKYDIYHICGEKNFDNLKEKMNILRQNPNYHLIGFSLEMPTLLRNADLVIARAGANTLAETSALSKATILIPLESAQNDHQNENAKIFQKQNAAVVISEKNLTGSSLLSIINRLMEDDEFRKLLGHHSQEFARQDATHDVVDSIYEYGRKDDK